MGGGGGGGGGIVAVNFAYCLKQLTVGITAYEQIIIIYLVRVRGGGGGVALYQKDFTTFGGVVGQGGVQTCKE